jgi:hypothetical protein
MTEGEMAAEIARLRAEEESYEQRWQEVWSESTKKADSP